METQIVLMSVHKFDRRRDAEAIENTVMSAEDIKQLITKGAAVLTISEFMDMFNNTDDIVDEIELGHHWMTYIKQKNGKDNK